MTATLIETNGERCLAVDSIGSAIGDYDTTRDLIQDALVERATVVAVPVERLDPAFFQLRSGIAGELIQKVLNYHLKFAVIGDVSTYVAASDALRDFVVECARGRDIIFASDMKSLTERLVAMQASVE